MIGLSTTINHDRPMEPPDSEAVYLCRPEEVLFSSCPGLSFMETTILVDLCGKLNARQNEPLG